MFAFHQLYNKDAAVRESECKEGRIGCASCKKQLVEFLTAAMAPLSEKRRAISSDTKIVDDILADGAVRAREVAARTMEEVRKAIHL